jgi:hypothetical protein
MLRDGSVIRGYHNLPMVSNHSQYYGTGANNDFDVNGMNFATTTEIGGPNGGNGG